MGGSDFLLAGELEGWRTGEVGGSFAGPVADGFLSAAIAILADGRQLREQIEVDTHGRAVQSVVDCPQRLGRAEIIRTSATRCG